DPDAAVPAPGAAAAAAAPVLPRRRAVTAPLLSVRDVTKRFGGLVAIDRLSLELERNAVLGLIGPNGSGKTTFFNVLTGLYPVDGGALEFDGRDITGLSPQAVYRAGVARTFQ